VRFIKAAADAGLYVHLRIGPYVCAEWNYGSASLSDSHLVLHFRFSFVSMKRRPN
jgi:hypothetical protein